MSLRDGGRVRRLFATNIVSLRDGGRVPVRWDGSTVLFATGLDGRMLVGVIGYLMENRFEEEEFETLAWSDFV